MRLPVWVRVLDAAAVVALVLTFFVFLFGGFTVSFSLTPMRVHSAGRLLFVTAALLAVRHAAYPSRPLYRRLFETLGTWNERPLTNTAGLALVSRVAVLVTAYLAVVTIGVPGELTGFELSPDKLLNLPARFDAGWYGGIALDGYSFYGNFERQQNIAFFPAFPLLMRVAGYPLGAFGPGLPHDRRMARLLWAGVIISMAAFAWAGAYLWRLARDMIGEERAADAVALLAAYPFALYFSAPYTEALFLLGAVAAVYHFRRDEWVTSGAWGLLVGLTRPNGCFLSIVLAALIAERMWKSHKNATFPSAAAAEPLPRDLAAARAGSNAGGGGNSHFSQSILAAAMPGIGMLLFSAYIYHLTGSPFGWARVHEGGWGRTYQGLAPVERAYGWLTDEGLLHVVEGVPFDTLNSLGLIFALLMLWPVLRRLGPALALFVVVNIVPPMLAGGVLSMGRLTGTLFPLFLALAAIVSSRASRTLVTVFAIAQGLATTLFFTWRPLF